MLITHVDIDPDGDTIIVLPYFRPLAAKSEPGTEESEHEEENDEEENDEGENGEDKNDEDPDAETPDPQKPDARKPDAQSWFRVSMKHLILASPRAKKMFGGNYAEAQPDADGLRRWTFEPIFDPRAFEIVLNAIHGYTHKLPRNVSLLRLAKISAIVDDLDCPQSLWFVAKIWIEDLDHDMALCEVRLWILISFVFDEPNLFESATRLAIRKGIVPFEAYQFPIRPKIIDTIDASRNSQIEKVVKGLESLIGDIEKEECNPQCKSLAFGTMTLKLMSANLVFPSPSAPYIGLSVFSIRNTLKGVKLPRIYRPSESLKINLKTWKDIWLVQDTTANASAQKEPRDVDNHSCNLRDLIIDSLSDLLTTPSGLKLSDFR